jgi:hypothetical protein
MRILLAATVALLCCIQSFSQKKTDAKFGKITPEDFNHKIYSIDSNANAVVIAEVGSTEIVGNSKGWFSLEYKHYRRVHILNKNGYDEAKVEIQLYFDGTTEEELNSLKAVTYNLEGGKVVETKLDKDNLFKDKISKHLIVKKFTFPAIREGSIIEYEYKTTSDFLFNLQPWQFQGGSPVLWSEYNVRMPEFFGYVFLSQGYQPFYINEREDSRDHFSVRDSRTASASDAVSFDAGITDYRWVMKDVPALKEESFTSTLANHVAMITFQQSETKYPLTPHNIMGTWPDMTQNLINDDSFGSALSRNNGWLGDVVKPLVAGASDDLEKAKRIYAYVRDNLTCTSRNRYLMDQNLKTILKNRSGTVAEINLLLVAMLKYADIPADPVLLSTRSHGYAYSLYPVIDRFNYVVARVEENGQDFYLDASSRLGFGKLPYDCYNGHAVVVNHDATPLEFSADSLHERSLASVILTSDNNGVISGSYQEIPGYYASNDIRETIRTKGLADYVKETQSDYGDILKVDNLHVDSLNRLDESVGVNYDIKLTQTDDKIVYINPMLGQGFKTNPFKSAERFYPVEMPYTVDQTFVFSMQVPNGYVVDELPKSARVKLNEEGDGEFEYIISESAGTISLRSRLRLKRAFYLPEEYEMLREFFNMVVMKHNEQIVLKKK